LYMSIVYPNFTKPKKAKPGYQSLAPGFIAAYCHPDNQIHFGLHILVQATYYKSCKDFE
jgi:hypothetical protein